MEEIYTFETGCRYYSISGGEIRINARTTDYILVDFGKGTKTYRVEVMPIKTIYGTEYVERAFVRGRYYLASSKVVEAHRKEQQC